MREVLFSVGEASGDLHASAVAGELRRLRPDLHLVGVGGPRMREAGVDVVEDIDRFTVIGFAEVLKAVPAHYLLLRRLRARLRSGRVALLVAVDYGGFNTMLALEARRAGVPVLYFITPQVWASRKGRLAKLAGRVTRAAVILPFEEQLFREHGVDATFVGHPLLDRAKDLPSAADARAQLGIASDGPLLSLFPGSRAQEVELLLDDFVAAARLLQSRTPGLRVAVSVAPTVRIDTARCPYPLVHGNSLTLLRASTAALCKSGTTTLEAAVVGCPLIVAYRLGRLTFEIAKRVIEIPNFSLVNIVAGREVTRELVQDAATPTAMADALAPLLDTSSAERARVLAGLAEVRAKLGEPGAAGRVARMAADLAR